MLSIADIGYSVAFPIHQTSLLFAGLLGLALFDELREPPGALAVFFAASALLVVGAAMLGVAVVK